MKSKILFLIFTLATLLVGCKSNFPVAQQSGKEDVAYILFVGDEKKYGKNNVVVNIDSTQFEAQVVQPDMAKRGGTQYQVTTGRRNVIVKYNGQVIYQKQLFLSAQETKIINLP